MVDATALMALGKLAEKDDAIHEKMDAQAQVMKDQGRQLDRIAESLSSLVTVHRWTVVGLIVLAGGEKVVSILTAA